MRIILSREAKTPVYLQIFEQIRRQILAGELLPGFRLPPERKLAESLKVNRTTVLNAYRELKAEGLVGSRVGKGTVVLSYPDEDAEAEAPKPAAQELAWNQLFSQYSNKFDAYFVKDLLTLASRKDVISFATGVASPETGPLQFLRGIEKELIENRNYRALLHTPTEGFISLREAIAALMHKKGVYCASREVMVLSGSQQGIDLVTRVVIDPGDIAVVEDPTFFPAIQALKTSGARVMGIPTDEKGMRIDLLEQLLQRYRPKLIYTVPNFQNPTGTEMELERRKRLVELAYRYRVLIMEDDAYGDLCYDGQPLPLLKSMDNEGYVIYLNTFSKSVYPGLRLGWMTAHPKLIRRCSDVKQIVDLHSNSLSQWLIERFIAGGEFEAHLARVGEDYRRRRNAMHNALQQHAPPGMTWNKPRGGYYIWCRLPEGVSAARLVDKAAEYKVVFVPGTPFCTADQGDHYIRLNFTFAPYKEIPEGIKGICRAVRELQEGAGGLESDKILEINPIV